MLKKAKLKAIGLMIALATPGFMTFSCSGKLSRDLRNASIDGAANWVSTRTFDTLQVVFPPNSGEDE